MPPTDPQNLSALLGRIFVNSVTGERGRLVETVDGFAMERTDRGENYLDRISGKRALNQNWSLYEPPSGKLRDEEMNLIARCADRALRAVERHEPFRFYALAEPTKEPTYDQGLVEVITVYLKGRA